MPEPGRSLVRKVARPYPPYLAAPTGMMIIMKKEIFEPPPSCDDVEDSVDGDDDIIEHPGLGLRQKGRQEISPATLLASDPHDGGHGDDDDYRNDDDDCDKKLPTVTIASALSCPI